MKLLRLPPAELLDEEFAVGKQRQALDRPAFLADEPLIRLPCGEVSIGVAADERTAVEKRVEGAIAQKPEGKKSSFVGYDMGERRVVAEQGRGCGNVGDRPVVKQVTVRVSLIQI